MYEIEPIHELEDRPDLVIAELLGVINKMANGNQRLENIIRTYEVLTTNYDRPDVYQPPHTNRARA